MAELSKFAKTVHYVCERADTQKLGHIKLNKILWYADTIAYRTTGKSITSEKYVKRQYGPVPKNILKTLRRLEGSGKIRIREAATPGKSREFVSLSDADVKPFNQGELDIIDSVLTEICDNHTATSASDMSHSIVRDVAELGSEIPVFAVLAEHSGVVTKEDQKWADKILSERS